MSPQMPSSSRSLQLPRRACSPEQLPLPPPTDDDLSALTVTNVTAAHTRSNSSASSDGVASAELSISHESVNQALYAFIASRGVQQKLQQADVSSLQINAYTSLLRALRSAYSQHTSLDEDVLDAIQQLQQQQPSLLTGALVHDLQTPLTDEVAHSALRLLGFLLHTSRLASTVFTPNAIIDLLRTLVRRASATADKTTCHLCIWVFASLRLPQSYLVAPSADTLTPGARIIDDILAVLVLGWSFCTPNIRFHSITIPLESCQALDTLLRLHRSLLFPDSTVTNPHPNRQHSSVPTPWLILAFGLLSSPVNKLRTRAIALFLNHLPIIAEHLPALSIDPLAHFMDRNHTKLVCEITDLISRSEHHGMQVFRIAIVLFAPFIQRLNAYTNGFLRMIEKSLNAKRASARVQAFISWRYLIYSFIESGYYARNASASSNASATSVKKVGLMMTPLSDSILHHKIEGLRIEAAKTWCALVYALDKDLGRYFDVVVEPILEHLLLAHTSTNEDSLDTPQKANDSVIVTPSTTRIQEDLSQTIKQANQLQRAGITLLIALLTPPSPNPTEIHPPFRLANLIDVTCDPFNYVAHVHPLEPRFVRSKARYFLELIRKLIAQIDYSRHPLDLNHEKEECTQSLVSSAVLVPKSIIAILIQLLRTLRYCFNQEINSTKESGECLITINWFLRDIVQDKFAQLNSISDISSPSTAVLLPIELLHFLLTTVSSHIPTRSLCSQRYHYRELAEVCQDRMQQLSLANAVTRLFRAPLVLSPMTHFAMLWIECGATGAEPDWYWSHLDTLLNLIATPKHHHVSDAIITSLYALVYVLTIQEGKLAQQLLQVWQRIAVTTVQYLRILPASKDSLNNYDNQTLELESLKSILLWPIIALVTTATSNDQTILEYDASHIWTQLCTIMLEMSNSPTSGNASDTPAIIDLCDDIVQLFDALTSATDNDEGSIQIQESTLDSIVGYVRLIVGQNKFPPTLCIPVSGGGRLTLNKRLKTERLMRYTSLWSPFFQLLMAVTDITYRHFITHLDLGVEGPVPHYVTDVIMLLSTVFSALPSAFLDWLTTVDAIDFFTHLSSTWLYDAAYLIALTPEDQDMFTTHLEKIWRVLIDRWESSRDLSQSVLNKLSKLLQTGLTSACPSISTDVLRCWHDSFATQPNLKLSPDLKSAVDASSRLYWLSSQEIEKSPQKDAIAYANDEPLTPSTKEQNGRKRRSHRHSNTGEDSTNNNNNEENNIDDSRQITPPAKRSKSTVTPIKDNARNGRISKELSHNGIKETNTSVLNDDNVEQNHRNQSVISLAHPDSATDMMADNDDDQLHDIVPMTNSLSNNCEDEQVETAMSTTQNTNDSIVANTNKINESEVEQAIIPIEIPAARSLIAKLNELVQNSQMLLQHDTLRDLFETQKLLAQLTNVVNKNIEARLL